MKKLELIIPERIEAEISRLQREIDSVAGLDASCNEVLLMLIRVGMDVWYSAGRKSYMPALDAAPCGTFTDWPVSE